MPSSKFWKSDNGMRIEPMAVCRPGRRRCDRATAPGLFVLWFFFFFFFFFGDEILHTHWYWQGVAQEIVKCHLELVEVLLRFKILLLFKQQKNEWKIALTKHRKWKIKEPERIHRKWQSTVPNNYPLSKIEYPIIIVYCMATCQIIIHSWIGRFSIFGRGYRGAIEIIREPGALLPIPPPAVTSMIHQDSGTLML